MAVWEQDGSDYGTFTYNFHGLNYTVQVHDGDDQLGGTLVSFIGPQLRLLQHGRRGLQAALEGTAPVGGGCGEGSCVSVQGMYISHFSGPG